MLNFTVGPVMSDEKIRAIGAEQVPYFRTPEFSAVMLENEKLMKQFAKAGDDARVVFITGSGTASMETSVYKGYKRDKIEMRGDRAEISDFPLYLNTVAGGLDRRDQTIGGFSFVVKIYALPVVEIIGQLLYLLGRYGFNAQFGDCL